MAQIVLGIGTSHTPMLNASATDWLKFIERDQPRPHLDKQGNTVSYEELVRRAGPEIAAQITPDAIAARHAAAIAHVDHIGYTIRAAGLDALIVVGDDQKELYGTDNQPSILVYHGATIRNVPLRKHGGAEWAARASARYYEPDMPRDYPVDASLALHIIDTLMDNEFDVACADHLPDGYGEGHAFGFVHNRLLNGTELPIVPVFLNTYYPPNQPTPARCYRLGETIAKAVQAYPGNARVGVLASGGLSHFTVDEELDGRIMRALREKDRSAIENLSRKQLNSGNSEIRNWLCMAAATRHLDLRSMDYIPAYRTPAGTGTGLCFAVWS